MASETKIGGIVYRCEKLPAADTIKLLVEMQNVFGGNPAVMASVASGVAGTGAHQAFIASTIGGDVDPNAVQDYLARMVQTCRAGSDPCIVGVKPAAMNDVIEVAWFAMGVQFRDFLSASLAAR
ncbi:phage tail assembly chaperone [Methylobacterium sp. WL8]|uniref:phage tail assembly chaperone n=1 Tax=Methylobacterium sp. WL8 TaxID=2603899 RepID=UPI0011C9BBBA|nr:hypothetical protein [Methylobacterium sp. WL8]TXN76684.1 hypothetical protein FV234_24455 [Methylobacterium sp. WL8]